MVKTGVVIHKIRVYLWPLESILRPLEAPVFQSGYLDLDPLKKNAPRRFVVFKPQAKTGQIMTVGMIHATHARA